MQISNFTMSYSKGHVAPTAEKADDPLARQVADEVNLALDHYRACATAMKNADLERHNRSPKEDLDLETGVVVLNDGSDVIGSDGPVAMTYKPEGDFDAFSSVQRYESRPYQGKHVRYDRETFSAGGIEMTISGDLAHINYLP